jgi:hypothetical protein
MLNITQSKETPKNNCIKNINSKSIPIMSEEILHTNSSRSSEEQKACPNLLNIYSSNAPLRMHRIDGIPARSEPYIAGFGLHFKLCSHRSRTGAKRVEKESGGHRRNGDRRDGES